MTENRTRPGPDDPVTVSYHEAVHQANKNHVTAITRARDAFNNTIREPWRTYTEAEIPARRVYDAAVVAANQTYDAALEAAAAVYEMAYQATMGGSRDQSA